jgi:hypothetical protein
MSTWQLKRAILAMEKTNAKLNGFNGNYPLATNT